MRSSAYDPTTDLPAGLRPLFAGFLPVIHFVLRVGTGLLFMQHGAQKLFGVLGGMGAPGATAELGSLMGLAGILEFFGGLMIVLGLLTRPTAFILAGEMVFAFFMAHMPQGGFPIQNGGELPLLYFVVYLFLFAAGAGALSLDRLIAGRKVVHEVSLGIPGRRKRTQEGARWSRSPRARPHSR